MHSAVTIITLGVKDVARASQFYQLLGWRRSSGASNDSISFFVLNNIVLAVFGEDALAADSGVSLAPDQHLHSPTPVPRIVLAQNYPSERAVQRALAEAIAAGGNELVAPQKTPWGGYHGVFADPDGHVWELAYNPFFPLAADGTVELPE